MNRPKINDLREHFRRTTRRARSRQTYDGGRGMSNHSEGALQLAGASRKMLADDERQPEGAACRRALVVHVGGA